MAHSAQYTVPTLNVKEKKSFSVTTIWLFIVKITLGIIVCIFQSEKVIVEDTSLNGAIKDSVIRVTGRKVFNL